MTHIGSSFDSMNSVLLKNKQLDSLCGSLGQQTVQFFAIQVFTYLAWFLGCCSLDLMATGSGWFLGVFFGKKLKNILQLLSYVRSTKWFCRKSIKKLLLGSGGGAVSRAVTFDTGGAGFESSH